MRLIMRHRSVPQITASDPRQIPGKDSPTPDRVCSGSAFAESFDKLQQRDCELPQKETSQKVQDDNRIGDKVDKVHRVSLQVLGATANPVDPGNVRSRNVSAESLARVSVSCQI